MKIKLERLSEENIVRARDMCDRFVSPGLYTLLSLKSLLADPRHDFYLIRDSDSYRGYFYAQRIRADEISAVPGFNYELITSLCNEEEEIGLFRSMGLDRHSRGSGLSDALVKHFRKSYEEEYKLALIIVPAWRQGDFVPAAKLLLRNGFHYFCYLTEPWADLPDLQCAYCGQERCTCNADVYYSNKRI